MKELITREEKLVEKYKNITWRIYNIMMKPYNNL